MTPRINILDVDPEAYRAVSHLERYVAQRIDKQLYELVKLRASMINGCAFCVDMHSRDALEQGESAQRLFGVSAWHEAPFYDDRERAALALTDAVTKLGPDGVPDDVYDTAAKHFPTEELVLLILAIAQINVWNRVAITGRVQPPIR
jgi:AhpD family alkylhydroperoxidase